MASILNPLSTLSVAKYQIGAYRYTPNTSIQHKPLLIYRGAFQASASASQIESYLGKVGVVAPQWRYTMYSKSHFHSISHEVLCVYSGSALLCFGCDGNAEKVEPVVEQGDVIIVPAGVAHRLVEDRTGNFSMVGSYPIGKGWDMCYDIKGRDENLKNIEKLDWFKKDPIYGDEGPSLEV